MRAFHPSQRHQGCQGNALTAQPARKTKFGQWQTSFVFVIWVLTGGINMSLEVNGKTIETNENGYLLNQEDWNEEVAKVIAEQEGIAMTDRHWDVVNYLRTEFFDNNGNQPNNRIMVKDMGKLWGEKIDTKTLFDLFPGTPSKQAGRIAGLPESMRKGGY
jgi:tRNA 2-thiouridine synthesizing protein E